MFDSIGHTLFGENCPRNYCRTAISFRPLFLQIYTFKYNEKFHHQFNQHLGPRSYRGRSWHWTKEQQLNFRHPKTLTACSKKAGFFVPARQTKINKLILVWYSGTAKGGV
jgi:hypothetical protein